MRKPTKIIAIALVFIMLIGMLAACESGNSNQPTTSGTTDAGPGNASLPGGKDIFKDNIKIAMISISTAGVSNRLNERALRDQASAYPNITLNLMDGEFNPNRQITLLEECVTQGYDGVLLEAMDPVALNQAIAACEAAGIPVISFNAARPSGLHSMHIRMQDYETGWQAGEIMAGMVGGEGTAIILDAPAVQKPSAPMGTAFEDFITGNTNIRLLEPPIGIENWSSENAQTAMRDMLGKYGPGEITMVFCANDDIAVGAMNAIDQAGRTGDIMVWGMFGYPAGLEGVQSGKMTGTMFSDVYVQLSMMFYLLLNHIMTGLTAVTGGYTETPFMQMPMFAVTSANVEDIMAASRWFS